MYLHLDYCIHCGTCSRLSILIALILAVMSLTALLISEYVPQKYSGKTFIYENSIILIDRVNTFYFSGITVRKSHDAQDHLLLIYFLSCESTIVQRTVISLTTTFTTGHNVLLTNPDALFLIEGSQINTKFAILNSTPSLYGNTSFIISKDMSTLKEFKENKLATSTHSTYIANLGYAGDNLFTYDVTTTGYYYLGFSPSGVTTVNVSYRIDGFNYSRPNVVPSCTLHLSTDSCKISVPVSLVLSYSDDYCLFGEISSDTFYVNSISVDVQYDVEHNGKWNFITILFLVLFLTTSCFCLATITCACSNGVKLKGRRGYYSIQ